MGPSKRRCNKPRLGRSNRKDTDMRIRSTVALPTILMIPFLSVASYANTKLPAAPAVPLTRTYVSGTGNDSSPCTASQPCATFQAALALTLAGGEIFVLNSANYGPVTINKALDRKSVV